jgi:glycerate kinase
MNILIAPDSFKESLTAIQVCQAIEKGIRIAVPDASITLLPMADGGEGSIEAIVFGGKGEIIETAAHGPLLRDIKSSFGIIRQTAVIEMAKASGLELLKPEERNPLVASSFGTGELIKQALDRGCNEMIICIGGSATNDGGVGALRALGVSFLDDHRQEIRPGGGSLNHLKAVDFSKLDRRIRKCKVKVACDVTNPLLGEKGAAKIFAGQKGADAIQIEILEKSMSHFAEITRFIVSHDISKEPGAGAAGGLGFGLMAYLNAKLESGFKIISELVNLESHIQNADLIVTGEGRIDSQTSFGKVPHGVAQLAKKYDKPILCLVGTKGNVSSFEDDFHGIHSLTDENTSKEYAMENASELLEELAETAMNIFIKEMA